MAHDIAKLASLCTQHAHAPTGLGHEVDDVGDGGFGWRGQTVFDVFVTLSQDLQIQRQYQSRATRHLGAFNQTGHKLAVTHDIKLKPKTSTCVFGHFFDGANAHGGEGEGDAKFLRCTSRQNFAIGVLHTNHAGGRNRHRHGCVLADHGGGGVATLHIDSYPLTEFDFLEIIFVGAVGTFSPAAGIRVIKKHFGYALFGQGFQVCNMGDNGHGNS